MSEIDFLKKVLLSDNISATIENNKEKLFEIIPELQYECNFEHNHPHHHLDVWNHTLLALENTEKDFEIRLCTLLHDIGKPFCYQDGDDGIRHFKNHPNKSKEICVDIFNRLNIEKDLARQMLYIIENHDTPITDFSDRKLEIKRLKVQYADACAHHPSTINKRLEKLNEISKKLNYHL